MKKNQKDGTKSTPVKYKITKKELKHIIEECNNNFQLTQNYCCSVDPITGKKWVVHFLRYPEKSINQIINKPTKRDNLIDEAAAYIEKYRGSLSMTSHRIARHILSMMEDTKTKNEI